MKLLSLIILFGFITPAKAEYIFADTLRCTYAYASEAKSFEDQFDIVKSEPQFSKNYRGSEIALEIKDNSFKVEFSQRGKRKVINQSVKNVWSLKRKPLEIVVKTKLNDADLTLSCR